MTIEIQQKTLRGWSVGDPLVSLVSGEYWDDGVSGKIPLWERPNGKLLFQDVAAGKIESVAVVYADRFGRTLLDGLQAAKQLEDKGVKLVAVSDGWDARRKDEPLYFQIRMMLAEHEHRRICERMAAGKARAIERDNAPLGGPLTFGYQIGTRGEYLIDPVQGPVVVQVFTLALQGLTMLEICRRVQDLARAGRRFQKRGEAAPRITDSHQNAKWTHAKVIRILRNRTYTGIRVWAGREFPVPALVDVDTFEAVQRIMDSKKPRATKGDLANGFLSGLLECGLCGGPYYHWPHHNRGVGGYEYVYHYYACQKVRVAGDEHCYGKVVRADVVDDSVWAMAKSYANDPGEMLRRAMRHDSDVSGATSDLAAAEGRLVADLVSIDSEAESLSREQQANGWPLAWLKPQFDVLNRRRGEVSESLRNVRRQRELAEEERSDTSSFISTLASLCSSFSDERTPEQKREVVKRMVIRVVVNTHGKGRGKTASLNVHFRWGESVSTQRCANDPSLEHQSVEEAISVTIDIPPRLNRHKS